MPTQHVDDSTSAPTGVPVVSDLQSLEMWRQTLVASVRADTPDLSARQMAIMLCVFLQDGPHTVRGLAADLKISKPAVSRALDRLGELDYIRRQRDDMDRRNVIVERTQAGANFLKSFVGLMHVAEGNVAKMQDRPMNFVIAPAAEPIYRAPDAVIGNWIEAA
jgi:DNA-binding MarR family transcriptional regulator